MCSRDGQREFMVMVQDMLICVIRLAYACVLQIEFIESWEHKNWIKEHPHTLQLDSIWRASYWHHGITTHMWLVPIGCQIFDSFQRPPLGLFPQGTPPWESQKTISTICPIKQHCLDSFLLTTCCILTCILKLVHAGSQVTWGHPCNFRCREHGSWDLSLHTWSQVLSPKYDMDACMTTLLGGEAWESGRVESWVELKASVDPTLNTNPTSICLHKNNQILTLLIIDHMFIIS